MSTILKALRRLEEENNAQSQRPLREQVTRGPSSTESRRGSWALWVALLGLGVAAGAGALTFWYLGRAPEPTQPTRLAATGSSELREEPSAVAKPPRKPRAAKPGRRRSSPSPAAETPSAASEPELPAAALASNVEVLKRPPAQPRIAAPEPDEPPASTRARSAQPPRMDPAEIPGRHKHPDMRTGSALAPSIPAQGEPDEPPGGAAVADGPATPQVATSTPAQEARSRAPVPPETEPRAAQPSEVASDPVVVAVAPRPERVAERAAPEPETASAVAPAPDVEKRAAAPKPKPTAEESSKKPAESGPAPPREREPAEAASSEIARAEIPDLRVERTVWHPIAERRVALIELEPSAERREIREGDAVGPLVVSKIEPSGVIFVHDGVELRRRIGE